MNDKLISIINNNEVVTTSRQVATNFDIPHYTVISAIEDNHNLPNFKKMYSVSTYLDDDNCEHKLYVMTASGFIATIIGLNLDNNESNISMLLNFYNAFTTAKNNIHSHHMEHEISQLTKQLKKCKKSKRPSKKQRRLNNSITSTKFYDKLSKYNINISKGAFFDFLRKHDYLENNSKVVQPTLWALHRGFFITKELSHNFGGRTYFSDNALITPKGQKYILDDLKLYYN